MLKINEHFYNLYGADSFIRKEHLHNEIEFIQVVKGKGTLLKNNKTYLFSDQTIFFIDARNAHIVFPETDEYLRNKIVIDADSFFGFCDDIGLKNAVETLSDAAPIPVDDIAVDRIFAEVAKLCSKTEETALGFAHRYIIELIQWMYKRSHTNSTVEGNTTVQKILDIIAKTEGRTNLKEISEALYLDKYYVCHLFKEKTGTTITAYISDFLYEKAKKTSK